MTSDVALTLGLPSHRTVTLTDDLWSNVGPGSYDVSCTLTPAFDSADDLDFA